jgi:hypothetical protein
VQAQDNWAFRDASENGHLETCQWLLAQVPEEQRLDMVQAQDNWAFRDASENGHLETCQWLLAQVPEGQRLAMVQAHCYGAFRYASANGHLETCKWLMAQVPEERRLDMVQAQSYYAFRYASQNGHLETCKWLLQTPQCLAFAEQHTQEYGERIVNPFIQETLSALHQEHSLSIQQNPNAVFNLNEPHRAQSCFYILRNLIRRNDPALNDEILFLLDIPSVKALLHTAVTPNQPNELLRLAITTGNQDAAVRLLTIPAVRELAERNNFYRDEARGQLDLRALAQDRESSMHALTTGEKKRVSQAIERYQPLIKTAGLEHLINALREQLIERYEANPAKITVHGKEIALPTRWDEFELMGLTEDKREEALLAYRQNKNHTALRYLSKPNYWMADNASFVYVNPDNTKERWSTFEGYEPEIALFWLAAQDVEMTPTDGHTLEGRLDHFVDELAHIGRAHNWDKTRINAHQEKEEYDDLEGDKPSCVSGVKRRLFQSVIGHPLINILTLDKLSDELRDFARSHFLKSITKDNKALIRDTLEEYEYTVDIQDNEGTRLLQSMDISPEHQQEFITYLSNKYGSQFNEEPRFMQFIKEEFKLEKDKSKPITCAHVLRFNGLTRLSDLLNKPQASGAKASEGGLFASQPSKDKEEDAKDSDLILK